MRSAVTNDICSNERPFLLRGEPTAGFKIRIAGGAWRVTLSSYLIAGGPWGQTLVCYFSIVFQGSPAICVGPSGMHKLGRHYTWERSFASAGFNIHLLKTP
jgi:hypothetical protein